MSRKEEMVEKGFKACENDDIIVCRDPSLCQHAKNCWQSDTGLFDPKRRPFFHCDVTFAASAAVKIDEERR